MLCTCHCNVKSVFSQIGQYKYIIIFVASCIKYKIYFSGYWLWWCLHHCGLLIVSVHLGGAPDWSPAPPLHLSPPHEGGDSGGGEGGHTGGDGGEVTGGEVTGAVVRGPVRPRPSDCTGHLAVKSRPRHQQSIHHQPQQHRHRAGAPHTAEPHPAAA